MCVPMFEPQHCNTSPDYSCPLSQKVSLQEIVKLRAGQGGSGHLPPDSRSPMELYFTVCSSLPSASLNHASVHRCRHSLVLQCCSAARGPSTQTAAAAPTSKQTRAWPGDAAADWHCCKLSQLLQNFTANTEQETRAAFHICVLVHSSVFKQTQLFV